MDKLPTLAALRDADATPHYFGLGFIQLKVSKSVRYHFWVPHWPAIPGATTEIHNHRYAFSSTVLSGQLHQRVFRLGSLSPTPAPGDEEVAEVSCKPGDLPRIVGYGQARLVRSMDTRAGESYRLEPCDFHCSEAPIPTITRLERGPMEMELARVVRPVGAPQACPFALDVGAQACWEEIARMLSAA